MADIQALGLCLRRMRAAGSPSSVAAAANASAAAAADDFEALCLTAQADESVAVRKGICLQQLLCHPYLSYTAPAAGRQAQGVWLLITSHSQGCEAPQLPASCLLLWASTAEAAAGSSRLLLPET